MDHAVLNRDSEWFGLGVWGAQRPRAGGQGARPPVGSGAKPLRRVALGGARGGVAPSSGTRSDPEGR